MTVLLELIQEIKPNIFIYFIRHLLKDFFLLFVTYFMYIYGNITNTEFYTQFPPFRLLTVTKIVIFFYKHWIQ